MRKPLLVVSVVMWALCSGISCEDDIAPPNIMIDVSPVGLLGSMDKMPREFDIQLYNNGDDLLRIESVESRGDPSCVFRFKGPDVKELGRNQSAFIHGWFEPSVPGDYHAALVIHSNSAQNDELVVGICGRALPAGAVPDTDLNDYTDDTDPDNDDVDPSDDYIPLEDCVAPAATDETCSEDRIEENL